MWGIYVGQIDSMWGIYVGQIDSMWGIYVGQIDSMWGIYNMLFGAHRLCHLLVSILT